MIIQNHQSGDHDHQMLKQRKCSGVLKLDVELEIL